MQTCRSCSKRKPLEDFSPSSRGRKGTWCKACNAEAAARYKKRKKEEQLADPSYVKQKPGPKPNPLIALRNAQERFRKEAERKAQRDYWAMLDKYGYTRDFKSYVRSRSKLMNVDFEVVWKLYTVEPHCAICKVKQEDIEKTLCMDHCHTEGNFRGLLCNNCNTGLGMFQDNTDLLKAAIDYLNER